MAKLKDLIDAALDKKHKTDDAQGALDGALASQVEVVRSAQANVDAKSKELADARTAEADDDRKLATALKGKLVYRTDADGKVVLFREDANDPKGWTSTVLESEDTDVPDEPAPTPTPEPVPPGPEPTPNPEPAPSPGTEPSPAPVSPEETEPGTPEPGQSTDARAVDYHGKPLVV